MTDILTYIPRATERKVLMVFVLLKKILIWFHEDRQEQGTLVNIK
jgi:hypothetical protein